MNIAITPTAATLMQQLIDLNHDTPEEIIEQALQYFYSQQLIDTSLGFVDSGESDLVQENEQRWQRFQQNRNGLSQAEVEARFLGINQ